MIKTKATDIVINAYNQLNKVEQREVFNYIEGSLNGTRLQRIMRGETLENLTKAEEMAVDIMKNSFKFRKSRK